MTGPVILVGFMGTGKSAVGRALAENLSLQFRDLDTVVEEKAGCTIAEIFAREGEEGFRRLESAALQDALHRTSEVIACGGGVVVSPDNLAVLSRHPGVFCLTALPETLLRRIGNDPRRPLLKSPKPPLERIRELLAERSALYAQIPRQVATDGYRPDEVAGQIAAMLQVEP